MKLHGYLPPGLIAELYVYYKHDDIFITTNMMTKVEFERR